MIDVTGLSHFLTQKVESSWVKAVNFTFRLRKAIYFEFWITVKSLI